MDSKKAIELMETLIVSVLKSGGFQDFKTLDEYRQALDKLKALAAAEKK